MGEPTNKDEEIEKDPSGRYARTGDLLGRGSFKSVYRAFDHDEGEERAWNQYHIFKLTPEEAAKLESEVAILKTLECPNIIKFHDSFTKPGDGHFVFITELMTSGTLKEYIQKRGASGVKLKVIKKWCRQILSGLVYLHKHEQPIIHRDIKCDNIFVNGSDGTVKIGDMGLSCVMHNSHAQSVIGTPEFMAPELYDEKYDEKVDIYAFGMTMLEMVTGEYPYKECNNAAQVFKKVTNGVPPGGLLRIKDDKVRNFIKRCIGPKDDRLTAEELLESDFLRKYPADAEPPEDRDVVELWPVGEEPKAVPAAAAAAPAAALQPPQQQQPQAASGVAAEVVQEGGQDNPVLVINLLIDIRGKKSNIEFPFNIHEDTIEQVVAEMASDLAIDPNECPNLQRILQDAIASRQRDSNRVDVTFDSCQGSEPISPTGTPDASPAKQPLQQTEPQQPPVQMQQPPVQMQPPIQQQQPVQPQQQQPPIQQQQPPIQQQQPPIQQQQQPIQQQPIQQQPIQQQPQTQPGVDNWVNQQVGLIQQAGMGQQQQQQQQQKPPSPGVQQQPPQAWRNEMPKAPSPRAQDQQQHQQQQHQQQQPVQQQQHQMQQPHGGQQQRSPAISAVGGGAFVGGGGEQSTDTLVGRASATSTPTSKDASASALAELDRFDMQNRQSAVANGQAAAYGQGQGQGQGQIPVGLRTQGNNSAANSNNGSAGPSPRPPSAGSDPQVRRGSNEPVRLATASGQRTPQASPTMGAAMNPPHQQGQQPAPQQQQTHTSQQQQPGQQQQVQQQGQHHQQQQQTAAERMAQKKPQVGNVPANTKPPKATGGGGQVVPGGGAMRTTPGQQRQPIRQGSDSTGMPTPSNTPSTLRHVASESMHVGIRKPSKGDIKQDTRPPKDADELVQESLKKFEDFGLGSSDGDIKPLPPKRGTSPTPSNGALPVVTQQQQVSGQARAAAHSTSGLGPVRSASTGGPAGKGKGAAKPGKLKRIDEPTLGSTSTEPGAIDSTSSGDNNSGKLSHNRSKSRSNLADLAVSAANSGGGTTRQPANSVSSQDSGKTAPPLRSFYQPALDKDTNESGRQRLPSTGGTPTTESALLGSSVNSDSMAFADSRVMVAGVQKADNAPR